MAADASWSRVGEGLRRLSKPSSEISPPDLVFSQDTLQRRMPHQVEQRIVKKCDYRLAELGNRPHECCGACAEQIDNDFPNGRARQHPEIPHFRSRLGSESPDHRSRECRHYAVCRRAAARNESLWTFERDRLPESDPGELEYQKDSEDKSHGDSKVIPFGAIRPRGFRKVSAKRSPRQ